MSTSAASASCTEQITSSVAGLIVSNVFPDTEFTNSLFMNRRVSISDTLMFDAMLNFRFMRKTEKDFFD